MTQFTDDGPSCDASLSAADRAYHWIRDAILTGRLPAGSQLNERELAVVIGVSRTPVREAIRRIEMGGMARAQRHSAAVVVAWTERDLHEVFQLRATLEGLAASIAAAHAAPEQIAEMESICGMMEAVFADTSIEHGERLDRISVGNTRFHSILLDATQSVRLPMLLAQLSNTPFVFRTYRWFSDEEVWRSMRYHREIVAALKVRDADWAATTMRAHILGNRASLLARMTSTQAHVSPGPNETGRAADDASKHKQVQGG